MRVSLHFQLNDAFTLYKKEKAENDRMSNETNDRLQKQLTELRSSHAKLTSQLEFSNKRFVGSITATAAASFFSSWSSLFFISLCISGMRCSRRLHPPTAERSLPYRTGTKKWLQWPNDTSTSSTP